MIKVPCRLTAQMDGELPGYIDGVWLFRKEDPLSVVLAMPSNNSEGHKDNKDNEWHFSRELLAEALDNPRKKVGYQDVIVIVAGPRILIQLSNDEGGTIRLTGQTYDAKIFLQKTYKEVPKKDEQAIINMALETFLAGVTRE